MGDKLSDRTPCARARKSGPPTAGCKGRSRGMYRGLRAFTAAALVVSAFGIVPSFAQKSGGILRVHAIDSPPSLSMHEEIDAVPARATMGVFNNLVMFDQHAKQPAPRSLLAGCWGFQILTRSANRAEIGANSFPAVAHCATVPG